MFAAVWFAVFGDAGAASRCRSARRCPAAERVGFFASYRVLFRDLREMYRTSPHTVYFLGASALFRDGLAAVFTFGAVLAVTVYGINSARRADLRRGGQRGRPRSGALTAGRFDDRLGPKTVIVVLAVRDAGVRRRSCCSCPGPRRSGSSG